MSRRFKAPRWEVADVIRRFGPQFRARGGVCKQHLRTLAALERCRTATLGGHIDACRECGAVRVSYNSCRNRHCPKCGGLQREVWIQARRFCLHILPPGFRRMRHYGFLSNFHKTRALHAARQALQVTPRKLQREPAQRREEALRQWLGRDPQDCPHCGATHSIVRVAIVPACSRAPPPSTFQVAVFS